MKEITLHRRSTKLELAGFLSASVFSLWITVVNFTAREPSIKACILSAFLVGVLSVWYYQSRFGTLRIDRNGIFIVRGNHRALSLSWDEVDSIGVASVCRMKGGLYQPGFSQCVGVRLATSSRLFESKLCVDNRRLSDYDILLSAHYGMPVDRFAAFLDERKKKFKKG